MFSRWSAAAIAVFLAAVVIVVALGPGPSPVSAKTAPSPSPTPTAAVSIAPPPAAPSIKPSVVPLVTPTPSATPVATPYMPIELVPNGNWDVIMQGPGNPVYSRMTLKADDTKITGKWFYFKAVYILSGTREGSRLKLEVKPSDKPDVKSVGKIDAAIDGIADMVGLITLNGVDTPFQGAQHSRVPPPVEAASPTPGANPYP